MKIDALISETLVELIESLNSRKVKKEDIVTVLQDISGQYIAIYYH